MRNGNTRPIGGKFRSGFAVVVCSKRGKEGDGPYVEEELSVEDYRCFVGRQTAVAKWVALEDVWRSDLGRLWQWGHEEFDRFRG